MSNLSSTVKEKNETPPKWQAIGGYTVHVRGQHSVSEDSIPVKVMGFDLLDTLISPASSGRQPPSSTDWKWKFPCIPDTLKTLHSEGYDIVIFSNEPVPPADDEDYLYHSQDRDIKTTKDVIDDMAVQLGIPVSAYLSVGNNFYRKPARGMFDLMLDAYYDQWPTPDPQGDLVDLAASAYVGDAAGRPLKNPDGGKTHETDEDKAFAENVGLKFSTPEEFFLDAPRVDEDKWVAR
jgi:bifunctional polynucleotide phosphatase/kinase